MGDILKYRIPNHNLVEQKGTFQEIENFRNISGFVLTTFDKKKKYQFNASNASEELSFSVEKPLCYTKKEYTDLATSFLEAIKDQCLSKAIFSRVKHAAFDSEPNDLFRQLCLAYPEAFVYFVSSPLFGTWIGASPEILIETQGNTAKTISLAGTLKRDSHEFWEDKEKNEQDFVTRFITSKLVESNVENLDISGQHEINAGPVRHLKTAFQFDLGLNSAIDIAERLHPTPAVSGFPQQEAIDLIGKSEKHDRKLYAGMIGVIDDDSTQLFVNLRCAEIIHNQAYLYLGGGFTKDSNIESEWIETENKAKTLLNVMKKQ